MNGALAQFNAFDWIVVVIVSVSMLLSLWRGFVREALSLAGWVAAFIVANLGAISFTEVIGDLIANRTGRYVVAWSVLFMVTLIACSIVAKLTSALIKASVLSALDRILGTGFGALRGALLVMALVFVVRALIPESERGAFENSRLMPHIDVLLSWTLRAFEEFRDRDIRGLTI